MSNGIDCSHWQGTIKWEQVAAAGIEFAIIKATEGTGWLDDQFRNNWNGAKANGILRGAYHYLRPGLDVEDQIDHYTDVVGPLGERDLIPWLDVETAQPGVNQPAVPLAQVVDEVAEAVSLLVDAYDCPVGIYTGKWFWDDLPQPQAGQFGGHPLWVATYYKDGKPGNPLLPKGWNKYAIHQHSSMGRVAGIAGNVDLNWTPGAITSLLRGGTGSAPWIAQAIASLKIAQTELGKTISILQEQI